MNQQAAMAEAAHETLVAGKDAITQQVIHVRRLEDLCARGVASDDDRRELEKAGLKLARMKGEAEQARRVLEITAPLAGE